jgi:hypothetical protein
MAGRKSGQESTLTGRDRDWQAPRGDVPGGGQASCRLNSCRLSFVKPVVFQRSDGDPLRVPFGQSRIRQRWLRRHGSGHSGKNCHQAGESQCAREQSHSTVWQVCQPAAIVRYKSPPEDARAVCICPWTAMARAFGAVAARSKACEQTGSRLMMAGRLFNSAAGRHPWRKRRRRKSTERLWV